MKQIDILLQRYAEGAITPEEQLELDRLTHREDILHAATMKATKIRTRRNAVVSVAASVALVVGLLLTFINMGDQGTTQDPLLAQADPVSQSSLQDVSPNTQSVDAKETKSPSSPKKVVAPHSHKTEKAETVSVRIRHDAGQEQVVAYNETEPFVHANSDPIVACNTQCSPDSVINDIWNFLKA